MTESEMMEVRADLGMVFQEGALFDSLTVGENVGYKLYEETDLPLDEVHARVEEVLGFVGLAEHIDKRRRSCRAASGAASRSPGRWRRSRRCCSTTSRPPASIRSPSLTIDAEIVKLRDLERRQHDRRHPPAARRVLRRRRTTRRARGGDVEIDAGRRGEGAKKPSS